MVSGRPAPYFNELRTAPRMLAYSKKMGADRPRFRRRRARSVLLISLFLLARALPVKPIQFQNGPFDTMRPSSCAHSLTFWSRIHGFAVETAPAPRPLQLPPVRTVGDGPWLVANSSPPLHEITLAFDKEMPCALYHVSGRICLPVPAEALDITPWMSMTLAQAGPNDHMALHAKQGDESTSATQESVSQPRRDPLLCWSQAFQPRL